VTYWAGYHRLISRAFGTHNNSRATFMTETKTRALGPRLNIACLKN
jgi:hypothetical protein